MPPTKMGLEGKQALDSLCDEKKRLNSSPQRK